MQHLSLYAKTQTFYFINEKTLEIYQSTEDVRTKFYSKFFFYTHVDGFTTAAVRMLLVETV